MPGRTFCSLVCCRYLRFFSLCSRLISFFHSFTCFCLLRPLFFLFSLSLLPLTGVRTTPHGALGALCLPVRRCWTKSLECTLLACLRLPICVWLDTERTTQNIKPDGVLLFFLSEPVGWLGRREPEEPNPISIVISVGIKGHFGRSWLYFRGFSWRRVI